MHDRGKVDRVSRDNICFYPDHVSSISTLNNTSYRPSIDMDRYRITQPRVNTLADRPGGLVVPSNAASVGSGVRTHRAEILSLFAV